MYGKKDSFAFFIVRILFIDSNIPNNICNSEFVGGTLRTDCSTLHFSNLFPKVCELISRILQQGGKVRKCHSSVKNIDKRQEDFSAFNNDANYLIRHILSKQNILIWITLCLFISVSTYSLFISFFLLGICQELQFLVFGN